MPSLAKNAATGVTRRNEASPWSGGKCDRRSAQGTETAAEKNEAGGGRISRYAADPGSRFAVSRRAR